MSKKDIDSDERSIGNINRRNVLRTIGSAGVAGVGTAGLAVADAGDQTGSDLEQTEEGTTEFISDNSETPEWFTINEEDELEYKLDGVYGSPFEIVDPQEVSTSDLGCLGSTMKAFGMEIGLTFCHYGGCEYEFKACAVVCVSTGRLDDCSQQYHLSGSLGPVANIRLSLYPNIIRVGPARHIVGLEVQGEVCRYDPLKGSVCSTVSHSYGNT